MADNITVPKEMMAAQVIEFNKPYKIHKIPAPQPDQLGPYDLLVKVAVASLCHTDAMMQAGIMGTTLPCTASHEGCGTVVAAGSEVSDFTGGDRIMCHLVLNPCGKCEDCQQPESLLQYCTAAGRRGLGLQADGAFAEYVVCDARTSIKLPDEVGFETAAPLACAGITIWRGIAKAELQAGQWLGLVGSGGGLGHIGIKFAKALGLKVIGIDARDEGLDLSKEYGADVVVDARKGDKEVIKEIENATKGLRCDATVNISDANSAAATAAAATRKHGLVVQIAQPTTGEKHARIVYSVPDICRPYADPEVVNVPFEEFIFRDVKFIGSRTSNPQQARQMMALVAEHNITVKTNAYHGLEKLPELVEYAHSGKMQGKGIVIVDEAQLKK